MPELRMPTFLADLYYDLRDRRLLPVLLLVVVATAAVPFLLGGDEEAYVPASGGGTALDASPSVASKLTVVEATPGLRDYRKRLNGRTPSDPFEQQYTSLPKAAQVQTSEGEGVAQRSGGGSSSVEVEGTDEATEPMPEPSHSSGNPGGTSQGSVDPGTPGLHFFSYRPNVRFGVAGSEDLTEYHSLPLGKLLPEKRPVVVFIGVSEDGKRAAFDISNEVALVRGPGRCVGGHQSCSVLILHAGQAADILTGAPDRNFRLAVTKIDFVEVDRSQAAHSSSAPAKRWGSGISQNFSK